MLLYSQAKRVLYTWRKSVRIAMIFLGLIPAGLNAFGQAGVVALHRFSEPVRIDGIVDEPQWKEVQPLPMVSHWPENGGDPSGNHEFRVAYDEDYIYLSGSCHISREDRKIRNYKRDAWGMDMDEVMLVLDSYNDNENSLIFSVTPSGSRIDVAMFNDMASGEFSLTWDTYWDAVVTQDDRGWYTEIRIPFSSLKFQSVEGKVIMGMSVLYYQAKGQIMDTYPGISDKWGFWSWAKASQAQRVSFENIRSNRPIYVSPYVLTGMEQTNPVNEVLMEYQTQTSKEFEAGLDVKYALLDNLTLDLTVNTDFAQVEADDAQVNLTRFSLFFPEKRDFFLERESNFRFKFSGVDQMFYSRTIGIHDGNKVRILGGARLVGRMGKWDVGLLELQTGKITGVPTENFGVYRFRRQVFNENSYMGAMVTTRLARGGYYNIAYGTDGIFRLFGDDYLGYNLAQTVDRDLNNAIGSLGASRIHLNWERRTFEGISYSASYDYAGSRYHPGMGFETREDFSNIAGELRYGWLPGENSRIERLQATLAASSYYRNGDRSLETLVIGPKFQLFGRNSDQIRGGLTTTRENLQDTFRLDQQTFVYPGIYNFAGVEFSYNTPQGRNLRCIFNLNTGGFYDGNRISLGVQPFWNLNRFLELSGFYQFNRLVFKERDQEFQAHIARFKLLVTINTHLELSSYIQYNSASMNSIINLRFHYNPRDGNDFYLVYNDGGDINRLHYDFEVPVSTYRTLLVKYVHTFRL